jgi:hypothetical protein
LDPNNPARKPKEESMLPIIYLLFDLGVGQWDWVTTEPDPIRPFDP